MKKGQLRKGPSETKPETAAEALARWDRGENVFTAEMGGLGPGYEQVIHIIAFETIRELLTQELPTDWSDEKIVRAFSEKITAAVSPRIEYLQCSGAQWGAAQNLAYRTVRFGWSKSLDELPPKRLIQVTKEFPQPTKARPF